MAGMNPTNDPVEIARMALNRAIEIIDAADIKHQEAKALIAVLRGLNPTAKEQPNAQGTPKEEPATDSTGKGEPSAKD